MTGPGGHPGPTPTPAPTLLPVQVVQWDGDRGVLDGGGRTFPFTRGDVIGFHPVPGLSAVAELGTDGSLLRLTLPGHPLAAGGRAGAAVRLGNGARPRPSWEAAAPAGRRRSARRSRPGRGSAARALPEGGTLVEARWPDAHLLLRERRTADHGALERRLVPGGERAARGAVGDSPGRRVPGRGAAAARARGDGPLGAGRGEPARWSASCARRSWPEARTSCSSTPVASLLGADEALGRLGDPDDAEARPFGAFIDWALTPDRRRYRTMGMAVAGGEDWRSTSSTPAARWSWTAPSPRCSSAVTSRRAARGCWRTARCSTSPRTCASVRAERPPPRGPATSTSSRGPATGPRRRTSRRVRLVRG